MFEGVSKYQKFAPLFLRFSLAIVFILFGAQKLTHPSQTTAEVQLLTNFELVDAAALNFYLGLIELAIATSFILGFKTRLFALISFLIVSMFFLSFLAKYGASLNPDLYRDIGLAGGSIALFLLGAGHLSLDNAKQSKKEEDE